MKQSRTHTGTYSCLKCFTEWELTFEKSLRCDDCGALLQKGTLEDLGVDADDQDDQDE